MSGPRIAVICIVALGALLGLTALFPEIDNDPQRTQAPSSDRTAAAPAFQQKDATIRYASAFGPFGRVGLLFFDDDDEERIVVPLADPAATIGETPFVARFVGSNGNYVDVALEDAEEAESVVLRASHLRYAGEYSGTIGTGDSALALTVKVGDDFGWGIAVLVLGLIPGLALAAYYFAKPRAESGHGKTPRSLDGLLALAGAVVTSLAGIKISEIYDPTFGSVSDYVTVGLIGLVVGGVVLAAVRKTGGEAKE